MKIERCEFTTMEFQRNLLYMIRKNGFSCSRFADKIGFNRKTVYGWVNGDTSPSAVTFMRICRMFGVSPEDMWYKEIE